jgi:phosphoenolpyruvate synthase/pyruvate phosphate dikinase
MNSENKPYKWTFVYSEGHSVIMNQTFFRAFIKYKNIPGILNTIFYINRRGLETCYTPLSELERIKLQGKRFFNKHYRINFKRQVDYTESKFERFFNKLKKVDMHSLSDKRLASTFKEYCSNLEPFLAYYQVSGGRIYLLLEQYVKHELSKYYPDQEIPLIYSLLLSENKIGKFERETYDLYTLASRKNITEKMLRNHAKNYSASYLNAYDEHKILASISAKIEQLKKEGLKPIEYKKRLTRIKNEIKRKQSEAVLKFRDNDKLIDLIDFLREQGAIRFEYKEWFMGAEYKFLEMFKEISSRIGISVHDFFASYSIDDTLNFLNNGVRLDDIEINRRKKVFILFKVDGKKHFASGDTAESFIRKYHPDKVSQTDTIKGITANPGKAIGKARIIHAKSFEQLEEDMKHFEKGEVLITTMTQPALVAIMKKAAAIVTNQGGLTSHAAVLSREFHIPCIVDTKIATEVFSNGDLIEVDADKSIVRKINEKRDKSIGHR